MVTGWPGAGCAGAARAGVVLGLGRGGEGMLGAADLGGSGLFRRVGDFPARVVGRGGVGVQGVQGEVGAGVAEVVLLPRHREVSRQQTSPAASGVGGQRVDLPGPAAAGGDPAADLPQADCLPLARPVVDGQGDRRVGQVVLVLAAPVIGAGDGRERVGGQLGGRALAPGEQVEPGRGVMSANRAGDQPPRSKHTVTRRPWPAMARRSGSRRANSPASESDGSAVTMNTGSPSWPVTRILHRGRGGELPPRHVGLLHVPGPVVDPGVPVHVEEPERVRPGRGVAAGQRHDQVRGLPGGGELAELAADRLDLRRPVQPEHPAQRRGRDPGGALGPTAARPAPGTPRSAASPVIP